MDDLVDTLEYFDDGQLEVALLLIMNLFSIITNSHHANHLVNSMHCSPLIAGYLNRASLVTLVLRTGVE